MARAAAGSPSSSRNFGTISTPARWGRASASQGVANVAGRFTDAVTAHPGVFVDGRAHRTGFFARPPFPPGGPEDGAAGLAPDASGQVASFQSVDSRSPAVAISDHQRRRASPHRDPAQRKEDDETHHRSRSTHRGFIVILLAIIARRRA
jgi:hypothetical protein